MCCLLSRSMYLMSFWSITASQSRFYYKYSVCFNLRSTTSRPTMSKVKMFLPVLHGETGRQVEKPAIITSSWLHPTTSQISPTTLVFMCLCSLDAMNHINRENAAYFKIISLQMYDVALGCSHEK